jgi:hypothetical protein
VFLSGPNNGIYQLVVSSSGVPSFTLVTSGSPVLNAYLLQDLNNPAVTWAVTVASDGVSIQITGASGLVTTKYINLTAPNQTVWALAVNGGTPVTLQRQQSIQFQPIIGTMFNYDTADPPPVLGIYGGWLPLYSQPGGPGTPTFPQQQNGAPIDPRNITGIPQEIGNAMFVFGCGHWTNHPEIIFANSNCGQAAIVRCPLCQYVNKIIVPASAIYTAPYEFIIP